MNNTIEEMSNKITDMTLNGATEEELAQAITESMVKIRRYSWNEKRDILDALKDAESEE